MPDASPLVTAPERVRQGDESIERQRQRRRLPWRLTVLVLALGALECIVAFSPMASLLVHLLIVLGILRWSTSSRAELGITIAAARRSVGPALAAAVIAGVAVAALVGVGMAVGGDQVAGSQADGTSDVWFRALIAIPLGTALFEEVLFRGWLLARWRRVTSTRWAVLATSVAFGLWHVVPEHLRIGGNWHDVTPAVLVTALAGAAIFCPLRLRTHSLLAPVLVHWSVNAAALLTVAALT